MASKSDAAWPLLGPLGVADDALLGPLGVADDGEETCDDDKAVAAAHTSLGREVEFWVEEDKRIWLLHTSNLDTPDPYGGDPIRSFTEVVCAHDDGLLLLRLHTQHRNFPTDYFVYDLVSSRAHRLLEIEPAIHSTSSMGLLRGDDGGYVAANLRLELDPKTAKLETFLRCNSFGSKKWSKHKVNHIQGLTEDQLWGWQTGRVIPFNGTLLWVDLSQGILWSTKLPPSSSEDCSIEFFFVPLLADLQGRPQDKDDTTCDRPEPFRTVGCCNGDVKLVNLTHHEHDGVAVAGRVRIWTLKWSDEENAVWEWKEQIHMDLDYTKIRSEISKDNIRSEITKDKIRSEITKDPPTADSLPCFPVLSTDQSNTLYLTLPEESTSRAWLLRVDLQDGKLKDYVEYPSFYDHMNPPYPSDLGNRKPADKNCRNETLDASRGLQTPIC